MPHLGCTTGSRAFILTHCKGNVIDSLLHFWEVLQLRLQFHPGLFIPVEMLARASELLFSGLHRESEVSQRMPSQRRLLLCEPQCSGLYAAQRPTEFRN